MFSSLRHVSLEHPRIYTVVLGGLGWKPRRLLAWSSLFVVMRSRHHRPRRQYLDPRGFSLLLPAFCTWGRCWANAPETKGRGVSRGSKTSETTISCFFFSYLPFIFLGSHKCTCHTSHPHALYIREGKGVRRRQVKAGCAGPTRTRREAKTGGRLTLYVPRG